MRCKMPLDTGKARMKVQGCMRNCYTEIGPEKPSTRGRSCAVRWASSSVIPGYGFTGDNARVSDLLKKGSSPSQLQSDVWANSAHASYSCDEARFQAMPLMPLEPPSIFPL
jgi:hypothetical protein